MSNVHLDKQNPDSKIVIGLTGNIGTGKSTVMRMLAELGAIGIDADKVAHEVVMPGELAYGQVLAEFGHEIAPNGGPIDRAGGSRLLQPNSTGPAGLSSTWPFPSASAGWWLMRKRRWSSSRRSNCWRPA